MMKKLLVLLILCLIPLTVRGQNQQISSYSDSMTSTDSLAQANYPTTIMLDTVLINVSLTTVLFEVQDSNKVLYFLAQLDSTRGLGTAAAALWKDSGRVHSVAVEFRYLLTPGQSPSGADSIGINGGQGVQWNTVFDSVVTDIKWMWKPIKVVPITNSIQIRIRDKNIISKGNRSGKWFRLKVYARRYF